MKLDELQIKEGETFLQTICGARLTSVQFVMDYLILGFDEKGALTALVWPELVEGGEKIKFGMSGYRDGLCNLICQIIKSVEFRNDETIIITFENKSQLRIPLQNRASSKERAIFTAPKHQLYVW
jgi:hypothetical protein